MTFYLKRTLQKGIFGKSNDKLSQKLRHFKVS